MYLSIGRMYMNNGRKSFIFLFCLALFFSAVCAPHALGDDELVGRVIEKQKSIKTISADFDQEKHSAMLNTPLVSQGHFSFQSPDKVAWIYTGQVQIVSDGKNLTVYYPELKEAEIIPVQKSLIRLPLNFNLEEFRHHFLLAVVERKGTYTVTLSPVEETSMFSKMIITLSGEGVPQTVEIFEKGGDRSLITFKNQKVNTKIPPGSFVLDLPKDAVIRRLQQQ
jgi:outer membrane lipoprotein-sorting protein